MPRAELRGGRGRHGRAIHDEDGAAGMYGFQQVDVFAERLHGGNPLAVVLPADGLTTEQMQRFSRWTNLSEATYVLEPSDPAADYRVRIFNLDRELPFAGHPTLGSCHAWLAAGGLPKDRDEIVQECGVGLVRVRRTAAGLAFAAPPLVRSGDVDEVFLAEVTARLGLSPDDVVASAWVDNGPGWVAVLLEHADAVLAVDPDTSRYTGPGSLDIGVVGPHAAGSETAWEVRGFFTDDAGMLREDPVTGSLNASLAQWLLGSGRGTAPYVASQGTRLGRSGRVHVTQDDDGTIWVGGATTTVVRGTAEL